MTLFSKGRMRLTGLAALAALAASQPAASAPAKEPYSPYATRPYPTRVYWGDTHLHTYVSFDAGAIGNGLNQRDAFRFARGDEVTSSGGERVRLSRPLDFLVVADHAENYGVFRGVHDGNPFVLLDPGMRRLRSVIGADRDTVAKVVGGLIQEHATQKHVKPGFVKRQIMQYYWDDFTRIADQYNEPGRFTAFIGYEYTSMPGGDNLHRNVIFRDDSRRASRILPFSTDDSENPEDLWKVLEAYERDTGGRVLAIPHNSNLSNGRMFALADFFGRPMTRNYAETRSRWEPIVEATQIKGDSESHPSLSPNDEFSGYERWDFGNLAMTARKKPGMIQYEYARQALKNGLMLEQRLGANPFKFGMIGSTDSHTSLAAVEENNFFGKHSLQEPTAERTSLPVLKFKNEEFPGWAQASSGYAAVWARENTREALFDAMMRREVYATTGSRMTVRVFGGWQFTPADLRAADVAVTGYRKGVPMGGDLRRAPPGRAPTLMVMAAKDPIGGNLDRVQVIKGWLDASGRVQEKVFDVAWSGDRKPDANGRLPPVGNTVDLNTVTWTNTIGAPELATVWTDPEFDARLRAFYYVRVVEIPTPRWTAYDVKRFGLKPDPQIPMTTQERAYTSPIWYTP